MKVFITGASGFIGSAVAKELISAGHLDRPWGVRTASFSDPVGNIGEIAKVIET